MSTIVDLLKELFPRFYAKYKRQVWTSVVLSIIAVYGFNSNTYKHWRYFDDKKIHVRCNQFPPITVDDNSFYYKYIIFVSSKYTDGIKVTDIKLKFQSGSNINNHAIMLSDIPSSTISFNVESHSILSARTDELNGGQAISISIDCSYPRNGLLFAENAATVDISYKLYGEVHTKSIYVNPVGGNFTTLPQKSSIIFDIYKILDNRMLPKSFLNYDYAKYATEAGDKSLRVYCEDTKPRFLKISYRSLSGVITQVSELPIHNDFDPLRIVVWNDNNISIYSWLGQFHVAEYMQGLKFVKKKDYKAGAIAFKKATELNPTDYEAWFNYGLALEYLQDHKSAIDAYKKAIGVNGDYSKAHSQLGNVLEKTGDRPGAIYHLKRSVELNPKNAIAYFNLGILQKLQGNHEEATININKAFELEPNVENKDKFKEILNKMSK